MQPSLCSRSLPGASDARGGAGDAEHRTRATGQRASRAGEGHGLIKHPWQVGMELADLSLGKACPSSPATALGGPLKGLLTGFQFWLWPFSSGAAHPHG